MTVASYGPEACIISIIFGLLGLTLGFLYCEGGSRLTKANHLGNISYRPKEQVRFQIRGKQKITACWPIDYPDNGVTVPGRSLWQQRFSSAVFLQTYLIKRKTFEWVQELSSAADLKCMHLFILSLYCRVERIRGQDAVGMFTFRSQLTFICILIIVCISASILFVLSWMLSWKRCM